MLTKDHRFHGLSSLRLVFKNGRTVRDKHCALRFHLNPRRKEYRLAVVVSRKVNKSAVVRNRIRRRLFEHFRQLDLTITKPYDLVLTVYSDEIAETPSAELNKMLTRLLSQAQVI